MAAEAFHRLQLDRLLFVPAGKPPHKPNHALTPDEHRLAMLDLAIAGRSGFAVSHADLDLQGPGYSIDLLRRLRGLYHDAKLFFIIGADSLRDFHTWHQPEQIPSLATIAVAGRPGVELEVQAAVERTPQLATNLVLIDIPLIEVSSTDIRARVQSGIPIWFQTPIAVELYINAHHLYSN